MTKGPGRPAVWHSRSRTVMSRWAGTAADARRRPGRVPPRSPLSGGRYSAAGASSSSLPSSQSIITATLPTALVIE